MTAGPPHTSNLSEIDRAWARRWVLVDRVMVGESTGMLKEIGLMVLTRALHAPAITQVSHAVEATGVMGVMANKGGAVISLRLYGASVAFAGSHLAAHMHGLATRNSNVREIVANTVLRGSSVTFDHAHQYVFWAGDLNYRLDKDLIEARARSGSTSSVGKLSTKFSAEEELGATDAELDSEQEDQLDEADAAQPGPGTAASRAGEASPDAVALEEPGAELAEQVSTSDSQTKATRLTVAKPTEIGTTLKGAARLRRHREILGYIHAGEWDTLWSYDQLRNCQRAGDIFVGWEDATISGEPTFKVERQAGCKYITKRVPSYCDRVLWKTGSGYEGDIRLLAAQGHPEVSSSDHKPVSADFALTLHMPPRISVQTPSRAPLLVFSYLSASRLLPADVSGASDPYVTFLAEPRGLIQPAGKNGGALADQALASTLCSGNPSSAPRTAVKYATLNPEWRVQSEVPVLRLNMVNPADLSAARLIFSLSDHDRTSADDPLGVAQLSLAPLVAAVTSSARGVDPEVGFELPVTLGTSAAGTLRGAARIVWPSDTDYSIFASQTMAGGCCTVM